MGRHYDFYEFSEALSLINADPYESEIRFITYLDKYPYDYSAYTYYASVLISIRKLDEAEKVLDDVCLMASNDSYFNKNISLYKTFLERYNYAKVKLLSYQNKYLDLYKTYIQPIYDTKAIITLDIDELTNNQTNKDGVNFTGLKLFCLKKIGDSQLAFKESSPYLFRQICRYSNDSFMEHIKKHMMDYNTNMEKNNVTLFVPDFPIDRVLKEVRNNIPNDKGLYFGFLDDTYTFKMDGCGRVNNKLTDYFQIVCLHDTKDFITMYPTLEGEYLPYIDLNYLNKDEQIINCKVKRKSQIDKFNQKYGTKL